MSMPIQRQSEQFSVFDTGTRWERDRPQHDLPRGLAGLVNGMGPRVTGGMLNTRTANSGCEYCGEPGHDWQVHPEAHADVADWEREKHGMEFPFGDHREGEYPSDDDHDGSYWPGKHGSRTAADSRWVDSKDGSGRKKCKNCGGVGYGSCVCKDCDKCGSSYYGSCDCGGSKREAGWNYPEFDRTDIDDYDHDLDRPDAAELADMERDREYERRMQPYLRKLDEQDPSRHIPGDYVDPREARLGSGRRPFDRAAKEASIRTAATCTECGKPCDWMWDEEPGSGARWPVSKCCDADITEDGPDEDRAYDTWKDDQLSGHDWREGALRPFDHAAAARLASDEERQQSEDKAKELADGLWNAFFPPEEEEGRIAVQNMDTVNNFMDNGWQPEHIKYDEDGQPYAQYQHPSGWTVTDRGGMYKDIGHVATPGEAHDVINVSRHDPDSRQSYNAPFGPQDAHDYIENQLHGDPEETSGIFDYLGQNDPRIRRHRPRQARRLAKDGDKASKCTCWEGYERVPGTEPCSEHSCRKESMRLAGAGVDDRDVRPGPLVDSPLYEQDPDDFFGRRPYSGPHCPDCGKPMRWVSGPTCRHGNLLVDAGWLNGRPDHTDVSWQETDDGWQHPVTGCRVRPSTKFPDEWEMVAPTSSKRRPYAIIGHHTDPHAMMARHDRTTGYAPRTAQMSYEDTMKYIDETLAAGEPEDHSDYSTDYSEGHREVLNPEVERYEGPPFPGARCDHCDRHYDQPFQVNDIDYGGDYKGRFCDDCLDDLIPSWANRAPQPGEYPVGDHPGHSRHQRPDWEQQGMTAEEWNEAGRPGWVTNNPRTAAAEGLDDLTQRKALNLVKGWMGRNYGHEDEDVEVPSGDRAYRSGGGLKLHPAWVGQWQDPFTGELNDFDPTPAILHEGHPGWADEASVDEDLVDALHGMGVHAENHGGYALTLHRYDDRPFSICNDCSLGYDAASPTCPECGTPNHNQRTAANLDMADLVRLAGDGMSYEDAMAHINEVLAGGEDHDLHRFPGTEADYARGARLTGAPGPHLLSIERHLVDEDYRDEQLDAGTHLLNPELAHEAHPSEQQAIDRMHEVAQDWGCEVNEYDPDEDSPEPPQPGVRYFQFDGPEEGEVQGYAELRPHTGHHTAAAPVQDPAVMAPQMPAAGGYQPGHRVGLPWRDEVIRGTVIGLDGDLAAVRWDDGQYSSEEPRNIQLL